MAFADDAGVRDLDFDGRITISIDHIEGVIVRELEIDIQISKIGGGCAVCQQPALRRSHNTGDINGYLESSSVDDRIGRYFYDYRSE